ncbi:MAG: NUDIX domain-containing protein [Rikenellaceae bacterium]|nr:NUDIX domain-containing protein [Rikenellaceae bacterium]
MSHKDYLHTYVSVDCLVYGFDGRSLNLLLVERRGMDGVADLKLPGSIIQNSEDTDQAAGRVLTELTGIKKMKLRQFRCFSSPERLSDPKDIKWLESEYGPRVDRLITVAYMALTRIDRRLNEVSKYKSARWCPLDNIGRMPFDHNRIVEQSLGEIRDWVTTEPAIMFELLPPKFTEAELRRLYEAVHGRKYDVRNFHKKMVAMDYVVKLDEKQRGVAHRAARYYKFDKVLYKNRMHSA